MDIDLVLLRQLEREKEISFDILIDALEQALLTAYHKTAGAQTQRAGAGRPQDRPGDGVRRRGRRGGRGHRGVRRHAGGLRTDRRDHRQAGDPAAAARRRGRREVRRVLRPRGRHRLRDHPAGPRPRRRPGRPRPARGAAAAGRAGAGGALRARHPDQVPGDQRPPRHARPAGEPLAQPPQPGQEALRARGPGDRRRHRRDLRDRARGRAPHQDRGEVEQQRGVNPKGACIGPMGQRVRNVMHELHGEKIDIIDWSDDPARLVANALSPGPGHRASRSSTPTRGRRG